MWPNAVDDLEGDVDVPYRSAYLGAAGMAWALDLLARDGLGPALPGLAELVDGLPDGFRRAPELVRLAPPPAPSLLFGESGVLLVAASIGGRGEHLDELHECVVRNASNPTLELCWGSPGTMVAALAMWRATGEAPWQESWIECAAWLIDQWEEPIWVQDLYGEKRQFTGAGHGFASNVFALLCGRDLLGDRAAEVARRAAEVIDRLALEENGLAQWWPVLGVEEGRIPVQWCHGSPGIVTSLAGLPRDQRTDELLSAAGELTWQAGPLVKGVGLCHGTAGNAYAFLSLYDRFGDERWLERARAFAMDAVADVERRRAAASRGRYTLFTGDIGVALLLRSCISGDPEFPLLGGGAWRSEPGT